MAEASRLQLFFQLYHLLRQPPPKQVKTLAKRMQIGERRVYRLLDELQVALGVEIIKEGTAYKLAESAASDFSPLLTAEEATTLYNLVSELPNTDLFGSAHRDQLLQKLAPIASGVATWNYLADKAQYLLNVRRLREAIDAGFQVQLIDYQSANSSTVSTRTLEPLELLPDLGLVIGYEVRAGQVKGFKLGRIGEVRIMKAQFVLREHHRYDPPDDFGFLNRGETWHAQLLMQQRAWLLFRQEFPVAARRAQCVETGWQLNLTVHDIRPLASFIFNYLDDLEVQGDALFLQALMRYWQEKSEKLAAWTMHHADEALID